ncbi:MAG: (cytosine-5-)-methyltransferase [Dehalococcoidia bacterium]|nr:(cytosine-5-)-methyltransferase [Dehalococcoidia bacterium]
MQRNTKQVALARGLRRNMTDAERALWFRLGRRQLVGVKFRRQQPIGPYIVDFVTFERKVVVEVDGGHHGETTTKADDEARSAWLRQEGFNVLRFWNNEVLSNPEGVLESILEALG